MACATSKVSRKVQPEEIEDQDFKAVFDGIKWTVEWKWDNEEPKLMNRCPVYPVPSDCHEAFTTEVDRWIQDGWLKEYDPTVHGYQDGVIPRMAVKQPNKQQKVRPVMDYRELNSHIMSHTGLDAAVCQEKLRSWRAKSEQAYVLDLRKAYLQIHVSERLQRFQVVKYNGKKYVMTRMGFGLNVAPKIMSKIITTVLELDDEVALGTDHYIDDIFVDASVVDIAKVKNHLTKYGLETKEPVPLSDARVLGLRVVAAEDGLHKWKRDGELPVLSETPTKREMFSVFGKLVGHYPVAGWLRTACSYVKRLANEVKWDVAIPEQVRKLAMEILDKVGEKDPVTGTWQVSRDGGAQVWCDASNLAVGCCLRVNGAVVEDAAWMRKEDDGGHINVAELEAVVKGLSMVVKWNISDVEIVTDSASVYNWIKSILEGTRRPKVSGLSEMITKRRLGIISQLIEEYNINMTIRLVPSAENIADSMTRVPKSWLQRVCVAVSAANILKDQVRNVHEKHHLGATRTLFLARKSLGDGIDPELVKEVVQECRMCQQVDPSPVRWEHGQLSVEKTWERLALDITYVGNFPYLSMIDCGPSRFTIWRKVTNESADQIIRNLE